MINELIASVVEQTCDEDPCEDDQCNYDSNVVSVHESHTDQQSLSPGLTQGELHWGAQLSLGRVGRVPNALGRV